MSKSELKPCPFCGGKMVVVHEMEDNRWLVFCHNCGGMMQSFMTKNDAVEHWNRRAGNE